MIYDVPQIFTPESFDSNSIMLDFSSYFSFIQEAECDDCRRYFLPFEDSDIFYFQFNDNVISVNIFNEEDVCEKKLDLNGLE